MSFKNDIDHYGRKLVSEAPGGVDQSARRLLDALNKMAQEVESLRARVANLESRVS